MNVVLVGLLLKSNIDLHSTLGHRVDRVETENHLHPGAIKGIALDGMEFVAL